MRDLINLPVWPFMLILGYPALTIAVLELARRLIDECHYGAFFIESGIYDFLNIQKKLKRGQEATEPMIAAPTRTRRREMAMMSNRLRFFSDC